MLNPACTTGASPGIDRVSLTPGDAVDGVVVAASAPHERIERAGISSGLEALAALHRKGALTDSEFAAAKAKLLG